MNSPEIILAEKYIQLKQLLVDGKTDQFELEIDQLNPNELFEFIFFARETYKGDFETDYYGIKILGEFAFQFSTKNALRLLPDKTFQNLDENFFRIIFQTLAYAAHKTFDLKYYSDTEKFLTSAVNYRFVSVEDKISFLSTLATCYNFLNLPEKELECCKKLMEIDNDNPKIIVNYAYALMRNKLYNQSKFYLEQCIKFGYEDFSVYNQLCTVTMYSSKNFEESFSYLEKIFEYSDGGKNLTDRNRYILFSNSLTVSGISGSKKLLEHIKEFQKFAKKIPDKDASKQWYELAEICESLNNGISELDNGNYLIAQNFFTNINKTSRKGEIIQLSNFLSKVCLILRDNEKIRDASDVKNLLAFVENLEVIELYQDYKEIIENYYFLLNSFMLLMNGNNIIPDLDFRKESLRRVSSINLTTSDFITKSLKIIKLIESYQEEFEKAILKERVHQEYEEKLNNLIKTPIELSNETTFLYSLNKVGNVNKALCELIVKIIKLLQVNEPSFIKDYKSNKTASLLENDFRDIFYRSFGLSYDVSISSESLSRVGRTDLKIESSKFGSKTFEFKVWGSNDYKEVVNQIYKYLTDFENEGFIFMVNKNKSSIEKEYIKNLKKKEMGYITGSLEKTALEGFEYLISKHKIHVKTKLIYHFIYNLY